MQKKSVLIVMPKLFWGGAEAQFRMLFETLMNNGDDPYIIAIGKSFNSSDYKNFIKKNASSVKELFRRIKLNKLTELFINIILLIYVFKLRMKGVRNLIVYETYWLLFIDIYKLLSINVIYSERNNGEHKHHYMYKLIAKCNFVTTNSVEAKNILEREIVDKKIELVNNGVRINPLKLENIDNKFKIYKVVVPARICEVKNQLLVVNALHEVEGIMVYFAGNISEENYYKALLEKIKALQQQDKFIFDGYVDNWLEKYKGFNLVLLPSLEEGTSNVILESYSNGRMVLVSDIPMNKRLVKDENFLFTSNNVSSLRNAILRLMKLSDEERSFIVEKNHIYVKNNYSVSCMVDAFKSKFI